MYTTMTTIMTKQEKQDRCIRFFSDLANKLSNEYEVVQSCNEDISKYLVPNGTADQISYYGKPVYSFRISDHWNWYSNVRKCSNERYVQCYSKDIPFARKREIPGKATTPRYGLQVSIFLNDGKYHAVYGEVFDKTSKSWYWKETTVDEVFNLYF